MKVEKGRIRANCKDRRNRVSFSFVFYRTSNHKKLHHWGCSTTQYQFHDTKFITWSMHHYFCSWIRSSIRPRKHVLARVKYRSHSYLSERNLRPWHHAKDHFSSKRNDQNHHHERKHVCFLFAWIWFTLALSTTNGFTAHFKIRQCQCVSLLLLSIRKADCYSL